MAGETALTLIGSLPEDPVVHFTPSGAAVAEFRVKVSARAYNRDTQKWETKPGKFWKCKAWNQGSMKLAENVAETLKQGDSVIVSGVLDVRAYDDQQGAKKYAEEVKVEAVGKDLKWHSAPAQAAPPATAGDAGAWTPNDPWSQPAQAGNQAANAWSNPQSTTAAPNAWNQPAPAAQNTGWPPSQGGANEPPF